MSQATVSTPTSEFGVDLTNVQGDVLHGFIKDYEHFVFFTIDDSKSFKASLPALKIATSEDVKNTRETVIKLKAESPGQRCPVKLLNISFSQKGLHALGIMDELNDEGFKMGQLNDARNLGDAPASQMEHEYRPNWKEAYFERIDGVLLTAGDSYQNAAEVMSDALAKLKDSIREVYRLEGKTRPGDQRANEHFGWRDGISNPIVKGVPFPGPQPPMPPPGQGVVDPGVILVGQKGGFKKDTTTPRPRPKWAFEGSFMVFRELQQLVPEFHHFLKNTPFPFPGVPLPPNEGSELQGVRFFGRWKNGVPIQSSPTSPNPEYLSEKKINSFDYPQETGNAGQEYCPYSAHIRKTRTRSDLPENRRNVTLINRKGIAYGEEVQPDEKDKHKTKYDRGLAFVCY